MISSAKDENSHELFRDIDRDMQELERNVDKVTATRDITNIVSETESILSKVSKPLELVELAIDLIIEFTHAERGFLMLFDDNGQMQFNIGRNNKGKNLNESDFRVSKTIVKQTLEKGHTIYVSNAQSDVQYKNHKSIQELDIRIVMCTPLHRGEKVLGIIYVDSQLAANEFSSEDLEVFEAFANHVVKYL